MKPSSLRIALVSEHASPLAGLLPSESGGQSCHVRSLARSLGALGHDVTVYTRRDDPAVDARVELCRGVIVEHLDAGPAHRIDQILLVAETGTFAEALGDRLRRGGMDVVHSHSWMSGHAAEQATAGMGLPWVHTFHGLTRAEDRHVPELPHHQVLLRRQRAEVEQRLLEGTDLAIVTSGSDLLTLRAWKPGVGRVAHIPTGFDDETYVAQGLRHPGSGRMRLAAAGSLTPEAGFPDLVRAVGLLEAWGRDLELVVAGGPEAGMIDHDPWAGELRALASDLDVVDRLVCLGHVDARTLAALYRSSDLFVAAPHTSGFGIAPLEAMACGRAVVATHVDDMTDLVADGETGLLVEPGDPSALAYAIEEVLAEPEQLDLMGRRAAVVAHDRYAWPVIALAVEAAYRSLRQDPEQGRT